MREIEEVKPGLFIQKTRLGYKRVFPIKKDLNKPFSLDNIHWKHLTIRDWNNLIFLVIFVSLMLFGTWVYKHDLAVCVDIIENPCKYYSAISQYCLMQNQIPADKAYITTREGIKTHQEVYGEPIPIDNWAWWNSSWNREVIPNGKIP